MGLLKKPERVKTAKVANRISQKSMTAEFVCSNHIVQKVSIPIVQKVIKKVTFVENILNVFYFLCFITLLLSR